MEVVDSAVSDVHPETDGVRLDRMTELEELCRSHSNNVMKVMDNQRQAVDAAVESAQRKVTGLEDRVARCTDTLESASERHRADGQALRIDLHNLKDLIDKSHEKIVEERGQCRRLLEEARQVLSDAEDRVQPELQSLQQPVAALDPLGLHGVQPQVEPQHQHRGRSHFRSAQRRLESMARSSSGSRESMRSILAQAQVTARARSPTSGTQVTALQSPAHSRAASAGSSSDAGVALSGSAAQYYQ